MALPTETRDRAGRLLVCTARAEEYRSCLDRLEGFAGKLHQNRRYHLKSTPRFQIRLTHLGVGPDQVKRGLRKMEGVLRPDLLIVAGTAGSLTDDLGAGSLFLPTALIRRRTSNWLYPEEDVLHWLYERIIGYTAEQPGDDEPPVRSGPLLTSGQPVLEPDERRQCREKYQCLAVDMESHPVVQHFRDPGSDQPLLWCGLRVLSDDPGRADEAEVKNAQATAAARLGSVLEYLLKNL